MKGSLPISAVGHAAIIGLLLLVPVAMPSRPKLDLTNAVDVVFAPPLPVEPPAPAPPPPPVVEQPSPPPPPPVVEQQPPPPAAQAEMPPPPPPKPVVKPRPKPPQPVVERPPEMPLPLPAPTPAPVAAPAPQVASLPPAPAAPVITSDYRSLLSNWLESHKHYPEEARQRGEEGRAVLRFRVDRLGRVLNYAVVSSTGFADLDAAVEGMMRGASLPPFPPSMAEPEIEVSVTIRFGLSH